MVEPQIRYCSSLDGTRLAVAHVGQAEDPPLLQCNTFASYPTQLQDNVGQGFWDRIRLGRHVVSFNRRGVGASQRDVDDVSYEAQVADLAVVADAAFPAGEFDLLAIFDATAIAIGYAARFPSRVKRMALWCPVVAPSDWINPAKSKALSNLIDTDWSLGRRAIADYLVPRGPEEARRKLSQALRDWIEPGVAAGYVRSLSEFDVREEAGLVKAPTLLLHPTRAGIPSGPAQMAGSLIPDSLLVPVDSDVSFPTTVSLAEMICSFFDKGSTDSSQYRFAEGPSGTAIILFADIVDSTGLTERLGDAAFREKARGLDEAMRAAIRDNGGMAVEGKTLGDGVLAVFTSAKQAIGCARACHEAAGAAELSLHAGIHAGDVIHEEDNVYGGAVNIAARVAAASVAGETLVSGTVRELARTSAGVTYEDRGEHSLKGIDDPVRVYEVRWRE